MLLYSYSLTSLCTSHLYFYFQKLPNYSGIILYALRFLLFQKLFQHNVLLPIHSWAVAILEVKSRGGQSSRMNVGLRQICWHNKKHNGLVYYASIMLAYWVDNIKYRSILSNRTVRVSTLVNYRSIFSNRTVIVKLSRGAMAPLGPPLCSWAFSYM